MVLCCIMHVAIDYCAGIFLINLTHNLTPWNVGRTLKILPVLPFSFEGVLHSTLSERD